MRGVVVDARDPVRVPGERKGGRGEGLLDVSKVPELYEAVPASGADLRREENGGKRKGGDRGGKKEEERGLKGLERELPAAS